MEATAFVPEARPYMIPPRDPKPLSGDQAWINTLIATYLHGHMEAILSILNAYPTPLMSSELATLLFKNYNVFAYNLLGIAESQRPNQSKDILPGAAMQTQPIAAAYGAPITNLTNRLDLRVDPSAAMRDGVALASRPLPDDAWRNGAWMTLVEEIRSDLQQRGLVIEIESDALQALIATPNSAPIVLIHVSTLETEPFTFGVIRHVNGETYNIIRNHSTTRAGLLAEIDALLAGIKLGGG